MGEGPRRGGGGVKGRRSAHSAGARAAALPPLGREVATLTQFPRLWHGEATTPPRGRPQFSKRRGKRRTAGRVGSGPAHTCFPAGARCLWKRPHPSPMQKAKAASATYFLPGEPQPVEDLTSFPRWTLAPCPTQTHRRGAEASGVQFPQTGISSEVPRGWGRPGPRTRSFRLGWRVPEHTHSGDGHTHSECN